MKASFAHFCLVIATLLLSACETPAPLTESCEDSADSTDYQWRTTEKGVSLYAKLYAANTKLEWEGAVNEQNRAHGFGKLRRFPDPAPGMAGPAFVDTQTGFMVDGRFEGVITGTSTRSGGDTSYDQYSQGRWDTSLGRESPMLTSFLNAVPAHGASTGTTAATQPASLGNAGNPNSAPAVLSSPAAAAVSGTSSVKPPQKTLKANLIDEWGLRRTLRSSGDHIKFYLMAADEAYESYQKSSADAYYEQHQQYAELARTFHERTGDETSGFAR